MKSNILLSIGISLVVLFGALTAFTHPRTATTPKTLIAAVQDDL
ncbi:MAG: hypothetical protein S4CHLAM2_16870 [Chlamydiales bacterium]|nr:hypothetical protein [Chlamydiales bacterium]